MKHGLEVAAERVVMIQRAGTIASPKGPTHFADIADDVAKTAIREAIVYRVLDG